jgi:putative peptidoglycan lipid II flippase
VPKGILGIASAIAMLALLAKGFGFFREVAVAVVFGAGVAKDAYTAAYIIPAFSLVMLGGLTGPFHTATQKVIATLRQRGEDEQIASVMATLFLAVAGVLGALTLLAYFEAPGLIRLVASHASPEVFSMAVMQLRIMSPLLLLGGLIGMLCGVSNDRGDYTLPSLSPLVASLAIIVAILLKRDPMMLAWGTTIGGVGQFLLQAPAGFKLLKMGPTRLNFRHPEVADMLRLLLPAAIASTIGTLNVIIGTNFASALPAGAISVFDYANKLVQLPLGILMTALLIPLFPLMTQAAVGDDRPTLFLWMNRGLQTIALATLPLIAMFIALGEPLVAVLYQHGAFNHQATVETYAVLAFTSLGIFTYACRDLLIRVFFALNDSRTPLLVTLLSMGVLTGAMALTIGPFGLMGLAGATAGVTAFNCALVAILLRFKLGELPLGRSLPTMGKAAVASLLAGCAAWGVLRLLPAGHSFMSHVISLLLPGLALAGVYIVALAALGLPVLSTFGTLLGRLRPLKAQASDRGNTS